ncbi:MAG: nitrogen regulation protein NR(II) [Pseudomonadota bacterium]
MTSESKTQGAIIEAMNTAVLLFDGELRLVYMNQSAEDLLAVSANQNVGVALGELWLDPAPFVIAAESALDGGHAITERNMRLILAEERSVRADCTFTPLNETFTAPAQAPAGGALADGGILLEMLRVDRSMRIAKEAQVVSQNETARAIVRGLAHEIRNPLGGLRGAAQLLERELENANLREYTQVIIGEADRLQNLLDRMLGPRSIPDKRALNVHQVTERVRSLIEAEAASNLTVVRDYDPSLPDVVGDYEQLIQAVLNIARNAVVAVEGAGTIVLRTRIQRNVTLNGQRHRLVARIEVEDDGPGVPPELMERMFYPMITGRPEGIGLGLSIAQSLVNQHGGLIECVSRPGQTVFSLLLPVED